MVWISFTNSIHQSLLEHHFVAMFMLWASCWLLIVSSVDTYPVVINVLRDCPDKLLRRYNQFRQQKCSSLLLFLSTNMIKLLCSYRIHGNDLLLVLHISSNMDLFPSLQSAHISTGCCKVSNQVSPADQRCELVEVACTENIFSQSSSEMTRPDSFSYFGLILFVECFLVAWILEYTLVIIIVIVMFVNSWRTFLNNMYLGFSESYPVLPFFPC